MKTGPRDDMSANNANLGDLKRVHDDLMLIRVVFVKPVFLNKHIHGVNLPSSRFPNGCDSICYNVQTESEARRWGRGMNNEAMARLFHGLDGAVEGDAGYWQITLEHARIICLTDEGHNRMRFIAPIREIDDMDKAEYERCLEANFHTALDIKYAISDGVLWSAFMHPFAELTESQAKDALQQVYNGVLTYGSSYNSSNLSFPASKENKSKLH